MLISIIIPAYNEEALLEDTINQIQNSFQTCQIENLDWELIVCDNNSTDSTGKIARALGVKVIFEPINQISRARNTGATMANGEWLLFLDADTYPFAETIKELWAAINSGQYIGGGSIVKVVDGSWWNKLRMERLNPSMRLLKWSGGAFIFCETEAFQKIDGFSHDLYALEEIDFVMRLKRYGRKLKKSFIVLHHYPVITSGRKGDRGIRSFATVAVSTTLSVFFLVVYFILPKRYRIKGSKRLLSFWYKR